MKICWDIEKDVPDLILGVPGADSGVKNSKNPKYVTRKISKKSSTNQKMYRNIGVGGMGRRPLNLYLLILLGNLRLRALGLKTRRQLLCSTDCFFCVEH